MLGVLMAVACFISPNPSPMAWMVSGRRAEVAELEAAVKTVPALRLVARAADGEIAFARFELSPSLVYGDWMALMNKTHGLQILRSEPSPTVPSCADGRAQDLGDSYAAPLVVGVFSDPAAAAITHELVWTTKPVRLANGQVGFSFEPQAGDGELYSLFIARVASWPDVQVVLLRSD